MEGIMAYAYDPELRPRIPELAGGHSHEHRPARPIVRNGSGAARGLADVLVTIISISLGILIGTAVHRAADAGSRRVSRRGDE
jgi:hypothetical protein